MSSIVVYQGLQSWLETQLMESKSFKLKLSSPKLVFSQSLELALQSRFVVPVENDSKKLENACSPPNLGGWSFLQTLPTTNSQTSCEKQSSYVDPYANHISSSWLSEKSLKLCTENLGSETGTDFIENSIFTPAAAYSKTETKVVVQVMKREKQQRCKGRRTSETRRPLPPPLTTLQGPESLKVRPYREDGRLILKATKTPAISSCFQADRSNGRLRLSVIDTAANTSDDSSQSQSHQDEQHGEHNNKQIMTTKVTTAPETTDCSIIKISSRAGNDINSDMDGEDSRRRQKNIMMTEDQNQERTASSSSSSSWCRCKDEGHNSIIKIKNKKEAGIIMNMVTSMVKLEPHFWVSSLS